MNKVFLVPVLWLAASAAFAADLPTVEVWKSPYCGCCGKWVEQMRAAGFQVNVHMSNDLMAARAATGMPDRYGACHSATVGGYAVEGHVPPEDVKRMLAQHPAAVGIAVPSMPPGSPGMEGAGKVAFDTLLVRANGGAAVFAHH